MRPAQGEGQQRKKVYANGSWYIGSLDGKGRRHGRGAMVFKDGTYEGDWRHGKQTGVGTYVWTSGSRYQGEWLDGRFEGKGTYTWPSGATYTGQWKNGRKHGQGRFLWANGTLYEGQFQEDKKMGFGEYTSGSDNTKYIGEYVDDKMHGEGTYLFSDGARYVGQFANNNFDGVGCYTTPDGTSYVGQFKDDQRHGVGLLKPPHLGTFKVRYIRGKIVEHQAAPMAMTDTEEEITFDVVVELSEEDLIRLGIAEFGKRKKLLVAIEQLPNFRASRTKKAAAPASLSSSSSRVHPALSFDPHCCPPARLVGRDAGGPSSAQLARADADTDHTEGSDDDDGSERALRFNEESDDDDELSIQAEDHYADLGDGLVLETEEKASSAYRKSSEFASGELEEHGDLFDATQGATYRLLNAKELRIQRHPVGRGVFGIVYSAGNVAVKKLVGALGEKELAELHREAQLLEYATPGLVAVSRMHVPCGRAGLMERHLLHRKLCHHPHVVNYLGLAKIPELCLVTQFYPKGSLYDIVIKRREPIGWKTIVGMARDAAAGILHLHCEHVIHRVNESARPPEDIATRNCLVDANYRVVVTDFGLSRVKTSAYLMTNNSFGPVSWMAPEALMERKFSEKSDAYSFGILLWELAARKSVVYPDEVSPFDIATVVIAGKRPAIPDSCPKELRELMQACWAPDPGQRPDFVRIEKSLAAYYYSLAE
ncbi:protein kinase domain containing protein [Acanthamoeba castellanii str. Neff]|uniref:Protein kinase domain containing protein n=1 Tax=Acanthamoeba castellanii (strain ATCC 30010 / Neff) TaxID=1257118 RepID=L8H2P5_ACACF|nr:protein kinase domain containing protein [Acanthamoeba castellanii str. Neff]ELR19495.1 protein kinase domain containing protein [Acanthamoeba castellanii str. Neff]